MSAEVIPFPLFRASGEATRDIVHVEPSFSASEWDVILSPARGGLSSIEGTYAAFADADTRARVIAQVRGAEYIDWQPTGGVA